MNRPQPLIEQFLEQSCSVASVTFTSRYSITGHNPRFASLFCPGRSAIGNDLLTLLNPESQSLLRSGKLENGQHCRLVFQSRAMLPVPLECHIFIRKDDCILIGEQLQQTNEDVLKTMSTLNNELTNLSRDLQRKNHELERANTMIKTLRGIIPICSFCKGIRNDEGYWKELEEYMSEQTEALFSHSICPKCMEQHYPHVK